MSALVTAEESLNAPFGSWELDTEKSELEKHFDNDSGILFTTSRMMGIYKNCIVKIVKEDNHHNLSQEEQFPPTFRYRLHGMKQEILMMILAGEDCTLLPVGRVFVNGIICGFIQPLGYTVVRELDPEYCNTEKLRPPPEAVPSPNELIDALMQLVSRIHSKNIVHSDIKPSNLILTKETPPRLLLCDFGSAGFDNCFPTIPGSTYQYSRPFRLSGPHKMPLRKADDLYATGITMWEIVSGFTPFDDIDPDYMVDVIACGLRPNLYAIADPTKRQLVKSYLEAGNPPVDHDSDSNYDQYACLTADLLFADCLAEPPHSYERTMHRSKCGLQLGKDCESFYRVPVGLCSIEEVKCRICNAN